MSWPASLDSITRRDVPLKDYTWYGIGGPAYLFCTPATEHELRQVLQAARQGNQTVRLLGLGANLLVRDGPVDGVVIRLQGDDFRKITFDGTTMTAGAGADLAKLTRTCVDRGLAGLECMAGIPATVGGAIRMNAGGKFGQIGSAVTGVRVLTPEGKPVDRTPEQMEFGYRRTNLNGAIVLSAQFRLETDGRDAVHSRFRDIWEYKKTSQPLADKNAGCIFKNPPHGFAAELIDRAGLKGTRCGGAEVSPIHANFITADVGTKADDVLALIDLVREHVRREYGVTLELEIEVW